MTKQKLSITYVYRTTHSIIHIKFRIQAKSSAVAGRLFQIPSTALLNTFVCLSDCYTLVLKALGVFLMTQGQVSLNDHKTCGYIMLEPLAATYTFLDDSEGTTFFSYSCCTTAAVFSELHDELASIERCSWCAASLR